MILKIKDPEKNDKELVFELRMDEGDVELVVSKGIDEWFLLTFTPDGRAVRHHSIHKSTGLDLDDEGSLIIENI